MSDPIEDATDEAFTDAYIECAWSTTSHILGARFPKNGPERTEAFDRAIRMIEFMKGRGND